MPNDEVASRSRAAANPAAARSSASSHEAGRSLPLSRTSGSVSRTCLPINRTFLGNAVSSWETRTSRAYRGGPGGSIATAGSGETGEAMGTVEICRTTIIKPTSPYAYPVGKGMTRRKGMPVAGRTARRRVLRITLPEGDATGGGAAAHADFLAAEEPLGIRVNGTARTLTMRTPGDDVELAAGFLVGEAVARSRADITGIKLCDGATCGHSDHDELGNIADVSLAPGITVAPGARRNFMTTSACGVCGKASIHDICVLPDEPLAADTVRFAPAVL